MPLCQHLNANIPVRMQGPSRLLPHVLQDWEAHHTRVSTHVPVLSTPDSSLLPSPLPTYLMILKKTHATDVHRLAGVLAYLT